MSLFGDILIINLFYAGKVQLMPEPVETRERVVPVVHPKTLLFADEVTGHCSTE